MDLNLSLSYTEQNDNLALLLADTTDNWAYTDTTTLTVGDTMADEEFYEIVTQATVDFTTYDAPNNLAGTRWVTNGTVALGAGDELAQVTPTIAEVDTEATMTLDTVVTASDDTDDTKTQVDLHTEFGAFVVQGDMEYDITAALLGDTTGTELVDGLYALTYSITYSGDGILTTKIDTLEVIILVYGQVKVLVYEKLRALPVTYNCNECRTVEIMDASLCGTYLTAIESSAYTAQTEELLSMLSTLENITINGSNITW